MPVFSPVFCPFFLLKKRPFFARFFIKLSPFEELVTLLQVSTMGRLAEWKASPLLSVGGSPPPLFPGACHRSVVPGPRGVQYTAVQCSALIH